MTLDLDFSRLWSRDHKSQTTLGIYNVSGHSPSILAHHSKTLATHEKVLPWMREKNGQKTHFQFAKCRVGVLFFQRVTLELFDNQASGLDLSNPFCLQNWTKWTCQIGSRSLLTRVRLGIRCPNPTPLDFYELWNIESHFNTCKELMSLKPSKQMTWAVELGHFQP